MRVRVAAAIAIAFILPVHAQEAPEPDAHLIYAPRLVFNQHLYYGGFAKPNAAAFDRKHNELWVADSGNDVIGIYRGDGAEIYAFSTKQSGSGIARLAIAPDGGVVAIDGNHRRLLRYNYRGVPQGEVSLVDIGEKPVFGAICYDSEGNLYVGENHSAQVFVYRPDGTLKLQFGSRGGDEGQFESIAAMAVGPDGTIYVVDARAIAVQLFDSQGNFIRGWGKHEMGSRNFSLASGIAVDSKGRIFVSDELRHEVSIFDTSGQFLGQFGGLGDGLGQLSFPTDVAVDDQDRVCVVERMTARVQVFAQATNNHP